MTISALAFPDPIFARALVLRALGMWPGVRVAYFLVELGLMGTPLSTPPSPFVPPLVAAGVVAIVGCLAVIDLRRRGERVLLANLGVASWIPFAIAAAVAVLLELVMSGVGRAVGGAP